MIQLNFKCAPSSLSHVFFYKSYLPWNLKITSFLTLQDKHNIGTCTLLVKLKLIALTKKQVRKSCSGLHYIYLK